ncbi:MAG: hypothetical protein ACYDGR_03710 [Candidatus Dormibacteria bacterium]
MIGSATSRKAKASPGRRGVSLSGWISKDARTHPGLAALAAVQAWEWLFSGLTKLQNDTFLKGFFSYVSHTGGVYGQILRTVVMTNPHAFAGAVEATELGLGIGLAVAAVGLMVPVRRVRFPSILLAGLFSLIGAAIAIQLQFMVGSTAPWVLGKNSFGPGVPVQALLAGVSVGALFQAYEAVRAEYRSRIFAT